MLDESSESREGVDRIMNHKKGSTSKSEKVTKREANFFPMNQHPELFEISPRPGGFLRHLADRNSSRSVITDASGKKPSTSASISKNGSPAGRANIGEILETSIRCPNARVPLSKEDKNNTVRMCSIAISTVMMLAQHRYEDITLEHVKYTEEYFRGLRQADGYPHNVRQLVQLLSNLKKNGKIVTSSVAEEEQEEETGLNEDQYED